jgi:hypothetical protein
MKLSPVITYLLLAFIISCKCTAQNNPRVSDIALGNKLIDAFYSFKRDTLQSLLLTAKSSQPDILNYQKWAQCANYKIVDRTHYFIKNDSIIIFPVTVKDDLMNALEIDFNVTDTFHIVIHNGKIVQVTTTSNDLAEYYKAKKWVNQNKPELVVKQCKDIWNGGLTPCECVLGMIKGFAEYTKNKQYKKQ